MADFEPPDGLGTNGVPEDGARQEGSGEPFRDTFFAPRDKNYLDFIARRMTKLRGTYCYYYVLTSQTERTDDIVPVSKNRLVGPLDNLPANLRHAGGERPDLLASALGVSAMYGEPVVIGHRLSSTEREVTKTWEFQEPIEVRGVLTDPERAEQPDARGSIYTQRIRLWLARVLCDEEWEIRPRIGDMVRVPTLTNPPRTQDDYYDIEEVVLNNTRFGATGFFTAYTLQLARSSRHAPDRKLPEKDLRDPPDPPV
jgi:hypothetical protein